MNCRTAREWIHLLLDDELSLGDRRRLDEHCQTCADCRSRRSQFTMIRGAMRASQVPVAGEPLVFTSPRRRWWPIPVAAVAAIGLLIGGYLLLGVSGSRHERMIVGNAPALKPAVEIVTAQNGPQELQVADAGSAAPAVEVEINPESNLIAVPMTTDNPKVTIIWTYPKIELAALGEEPRPERQRF